MIKIGMLALLMTAQLAMGATVAVIDSGTDYKHDGLKGHIWTNENDSLSNGRDDDQNGYKDDFYGWNFAENNNQVIDYKYVGTFSHDVYKFFEIQTKIITGVATEAEKRWYKEKRSDQKFIQELSKFGNFVHGTHVTGIAVRESQAAQSLAIKLIPTEVSPFAEQAKKAAVNGPKNDAIIVMMLKMMLGQLAERQSKTLTTIGQYVHGHKAHIANGSFGTGHKNAKMIIDQLYRGMGGEPTEAVLTELANHFVNEILKHSKSFVTSAPKTLFVFAAGNDGLDNDVYASSPTNLKEPNVISVAATLGRKTLATFSNYGRKMVDVAAPGVAIESTIPGDDLLRVSGTSQAAPAVAKVAAQLVDTNKSLKAADIKKILIGTVDKKDFLKGKILSEGIVNEERAVTAAHLAKTMTITKAITESLTMVEDVSTKSTDHMINSDLILPLPLTSQFK